MKVNDLNPQEYWDTSKHDLELANDVQGAWRQGVDDAQHEHKKRQEKDEQYKVQHAASWDRLKAKTGR